MRSSSLRARLMAMAMTRDCGLWTSTSRLSGGCSPAVNACTRCASVSADARKQRLEAGLVLCYRARPLARHQLTKGVRTDRRPKAEVEELGEAVPRRRTLVLLHLEEPHLGAVFKVV